MATPESVKGYVVGPVQRALDVLIALGTARRPLALTEICHSVRMPKTTVFRYLHTLTSRGFVAHDPTTDLYRLGSRLFELGQLAGDQLRIRDVAMPVMHRLRAQFNETVNLGVMDGKEIVYLEMVESHHALRMQATLGSRDPVYATALGKAMLAHVEEARWREHLPPRLAPRTGRTVSSLPALKEVLAAVRRQGYALDDEENEDGARCIGAPIFDYAGQVKAAVSVSAPVNRLTDALLPGVVAGVVEAAQLISRQLGYRPDAATG